MRKRAYDIVEYFQVEVADAENQNKSRRGTHFPGKKKKKKLYTWGAVERNLHTGQFSL